MHTPRGPLLQTAHRWHWVRRHAPTIEGINRLCAHTLEHKNTLMAPVPLLMRNYEYILTIFNTSAQCPIILPPRYYRPDLQTYEELRAPADTAHPNAITIATHLWATLLKRTLFKKAMAESKPNHIYLLLTSRLTFEWMCKPYAKQAQTAP
jgi:hypothetical protein